MTLIEDIVPSSKLTEGFTWMISGLTVGMAAGASMSGKVIDILGVQFGVSVAVVSGIFIIFMTVFSCRIISTRRHE